MKKIYSRVHFILGIILLFAISCKKTSDSITPSITVSTPSKDNIIAFTSDGGDASFHITTNTSWNIVNTKNNLANTFYTLSATSGKKEDSIIQIHVTSNPYPYVRYDTMYVVASNVVDTVFVEQSGITASGTLLVSFKNLYYRAGVDSIVAADITLSENGMLHIYTNLPIDGSDNASFRSNTIPITSTTKMVAAVFKNQNGKVRNWWNWNEGIAMPATIDINDAQYYFSSGDGSNLNPYIISNPAQMNNLRKSYHDGLFIKQDRDIDFADAIGLVKLNDTSFDFSKNDTLAVFYNNQTGWIPIGIAGGGLPFKGNYDGRGFKIKGLMMNRTSTASSSQVTGLFGVFSGIKIENVIVDNSSLLLGTNSVGSIVGNMQGGSIEHCGNYAIVKGVQFVGGIVGSMNGGTIQNSFNKGNVIATSYVGGIVGGMYDQAILNNCYNNASVKGNWWIGGLLGYGVGNNCNISNSYNAGVVSTPITTNINAIGGIVGGLSKDVLPIVFQNCYYLKEGSINNIEGVGGNPTIVGITPSSASSLTNAIIGLGSAWKADNGQNNGFPILSWQ